MSLDQLEDGEEGDDDLQAVVAGGEQFAEGGHPVTVEHIGDHGNLLADGDAGGGDNTAKGWDESGLCIDLPGSSDQVSKGDTAEVDCAIVPGGRSQAKVGTQTSGLALGEEVSDLTIALVGDELMGKGFTWVFFSRLATGRAGKKGFGLDLDQSGGDDQEGGDFVSDLFGEVPDILEVLVGDKGQREAGYIQLSVLDELQEQVEGSFVDRGVDGVAGELVANGIESHRQDYT